MDPLAEKTSNGQVVTYAKNEHPYFFLACVIMNTEIPDFWPGNPKAWFLKFEAYMYLQKQDDVDDVINDRYKFDIAVTKLKDYLDIKVISDLIINPTITEKYEALKKILLKMFLCPVQRGNKTIQKMEKMIKELKSSNDKLSEGMSKIVDLLSSQYEVKGGDDSPSLSNGRVAMNKDGWLCWHHWSNGKNAIE